MKSILLSSLMLLMLCACSNTRAQEAADGSTDSLSAAPAHSEKRAVYYWKTTLRIDSAERAFLRRHDVGRIYLRLFDVVPYPEGRRLEEKTVPNASLQVDGENYRLLSDSLNTLDVVPVVYITLDALKTMSGHEDVLASNIVTRVANMCSYNALTNVSELQLDCDWTVSTEQSFFDLCSAVRKEIAEQKRGWQLSSTIRLHQLARKAPPVDRGVLMVYNTGNFSDPDAANSIIDPADVEPYVKRLSTYPLHLDVAYPTYSWQLLFHDRKFAGLLSGLNLTDSTRFEPIGKSTYKALRDIPYKDRMICRGDMVREETSRYADVARVRDMIESRISNHPHSTILYHLDTNNLSKYSPDEIDDLLASGH